MDENQKHLSITAILRFVLKELSTDLYRCFCFSHQTELFPFLSGKAEEAACTTRITTAEPQHSQQPQKWAQSEFLVPKRDPHQVVIGQDGLWWGSCSGSNSGFFIVGLHRHPNVEKKKRWLMSPSVYDAEKPQIPQSEKIAELPALCKLNNQKCIRESQTFFPSLCSSCRKKKSPN